MVVITSYSIHYTKLYELTGEMAVEIGGKMKVVIALDVDQTGAALLQAAQRA